MPTEPRTLVRPFPRTSHANPNRGAKLFLSGPVIPRGTPGSGEISLPHMAVAGNNRVGRALLSDCLAKFVGAKPVVALHFHMQARFASVGCQEVRLQNIQKPAA